MQKHFRIVTAALLLLSLCSYAFGESKTESSLRQERSKLPKASGPVDRTKIEIKIADLLLTLLTDAARSDNDKLVEQYLNEYSSTIQDAHRTIMESGIDAHKHTAGYKDLEITLRKHQRLLADAGKMLNYDQREPIEKVQKRASDMSDQLVKIMLLKEPNAPRKP